MTIKHLVLSGGGPIGIVYLGALEYIHNEGFWKIEDIESIYATSVGTMLAVVLGLKYDWETINTYFIDRPWKDLFKVTAKQIVDVYTRKGLFDNTHIDKMFKPLLQAKDLSLTITMKEFYEYTKIEMFFYAFDLNTYKTIELSYKTHPDLLLTKAVYMSSSVPGLFVPTFLDDKCIIDGYPLANFPINYCLKDHNDLDEILGFNYVCTNTDGEECMGNNIITEDSNMLDFILSISTNSINYITNSIKEENIPNIIEIKSNTGSTITIDDMTKFLNSPEYRKSLFDTGIENGKIFIEKHKLLNKTDGKTDEVKVKEKDEMIEVDTINL